MDEAFVEPFHENCCSHPGFFVRLPENWKMLHVLALEGTWTEGTVEQHGLGEAITRRISAEHEGEPILGRLKALSLFLLLRYECP